MNDERELTETELDAVSGGVDVCGQTICFPIGMVNGVTVVAPAPTGGGGGGLVHEPTHAN